MQNGIDKIIALENGRHNNAYRIKKHYLQQLFWECTLKCNLKCRHCGSECAFDDQRSEMPLEDFVRVLDEIKTQIKHPILIITTGGEPLMREDIIGCGREIKKRGYYWGMVSNGTFLKENVFNNLIGNGLDSLSISLDGLIEEHNWMRQSETSYYDAINAIDLLSRKPSSLTWDVITCINKKNVVHLYELKELLIAHNVKRWKIFTIFPLGRACSEKDLILDGKQLRLLMDFIVEARKDKIIKVSYGCEGFLGPYEYAVRDSQYFCASGINVASILHDGSISGCLSVRYDYSQGNIYEDSFMEVWNDRFEKYRDHFWMKTGACKECEVWRWCEGNGMHLRDNKGKLLLCNYNKMFKQQ